ncbi:3-hydroxyacyl-CoA dehydrogenase family protein [Paenibacillus sp. GCM10027626]|uniref:3-hydroxyacyl-CoA dehydrogenase family protein n=1 Tax=Paenibacillus sp. GCM10027626 TaxID=3273411 RepID=UPI00363C454C
MIKQIAVLGAGTMGLGIALLFARHGYSVSLYEPDHHNHETIQQQIRSQICSTSGSNSLNLKLSCDLEKAVSNAEFIIEAAPEQLETKQELYSQLAQWIKDDAIVASNTSTYSLDTLAQSQPFASRMIIAHFFNPPQIIPLVELVGLPVTQQVILQQIADLLAECGKAPIILHKDIPGFIANRLQAALMREACYLLECGIADAEQIDRAVTEGIGLRWALAGPFEIADLGGLDIWSKVTGHLFPQLSNDTAVPAAIEQKVAQGELGAKTGQGYYSYPDPAGAARTMNSRLQQVQALKNNSPTKE